MPQESCAGPMLYSRYASTVQEFLCNDIDIHGYAVDHIVKNSFAGSPRIEENTYLTLEYSIADIKSCMDQNRLKINIENINRIHSDRITTTFV